VLVAFVVWFRMLHKEIGWEERLRSDQFCVEWDVKLDQSVLVFALTFHKSCVLIILGLHVKLKLPLYAD